MRTLNCSPANSVRPWRARIVFERFLGVHRIQRVPPNEKQGRRHSSTVAVVEATVFTPEPLDVSLVVETHIRGSGKGGQHRNKVATGIRLVHPLITVEATERRSQDQNRQAAWQRLRERWDSLQVPPEPDRTTSKREWTWCAWRDEVKAPNGRRGSYRRSLRGNLDWA